MAGFEVWPALETERALDGVSRQYFVGDLKRPQTMRFRRDDRLEVGLTSYESPTSEAPHHHAGALELQYVLSGMTEYLDLDSGEVHRFITGDFFAIDTPTRYAQRSRAGTRIFFVKVPSVNDKLSDPVSPDVQEWMDGRVESTRTDYWHDSDAPRANSLRPAAAVAVINGNNELLMLRRSDNGYWTMPGGTLEAAESLPECAVREVFEETGIVVQLEALIGTYTDPGVRIAYSDGEVRREFSMLFVSRVEVNEVILDGESTDWAWVPIEEAAHLPLAESQRRRVEDVAEWVRTGKVSLR